MRTQRSERGNWLGKRARGSADDVTADNERGIHKRSTGRVRGDGCGTIFKNGMAKKRTRGSGEDVFGSIGCVLERRPGETHV